MCFMGLLPAFGVGMVNFDKTKPIVAKSLSVAAISFRGYDYTLAKCTARKFSRETSRIDVAYCKSERYVEKPSPNLTFFGLWNMLWEESCTGSFTGTTDR